MNGVYHALAALILWRIVLLLRMSSSQALFVAVAFAAHPLACETVCWASERKNTLAALFGFAAVWVWLRLSADRSVKGLAARVIATAGLYCLALMSKPSALGIFPVLLVMELFGAPDGLDSDKQAFWRPSNAWLSVAARLLPLVALSIVIAQINIAGHARTLLPPPGGSIFTAALTDLEILARYLKNLLLPLDLSAAYFVQPIVSPADWRVAAYGLLLLCTVVISMRLAARPRVALLGWLWFVGALGPSLNFIAISYLMQDRYVYLSTPGFFIVVAEVAAGLATRISLAPVLRIAAPAYIGLFAILGFVRGTVWTTTFEVFDDAVKKQPLSSFGQNGLGIAYAQAWHTHAKAGVPDPKNQAPEFRRKWIEHWRLSLLCPDADRNLYYCVMANRVGEDYQAQSNLQEAEHYWALGAYPPPNRPDEPEARAKCLAHLSELRLAEGKTNEAFIKANEAIDASVRDTSLFARGSSAIVLAREKRAAGDEAFARRLLDEARRDLEAIVAASKLFPEARKALAHPDFALNAPTPRN